MPLKLTKNVSDSNINHLLSIDSSGTSRGELRIGNNTTSGSMICIVTAGNVGIGTTSPTALLHVFNGCVKVGGSMNITNDNVAAYFWNQATVGPTISGYKFEVKTGDDTTRFSINNNGRIGIGTTIPNGEVSLSNNLINRKIVLYEENSADNITSGTNFYGLGVNGGVFRLQIPSAASPGNSFHFLHGGTLIGKISLSGYSNNFTGQHRCAIKNVTQSQINNLSGLIVSANNDDYINMSNGTVRGKEAMKINESLPIVSLTNLSHDKSVFGVISCAEDPVERSDQYGSFSTFFHKERGDTRVYVNSIGEGAIWVSNANGSLESGDYITSSSIPGYGTKQNEVTLCNFTVAKITRNCDFSNPQLPKYKIKRDSYDNNVLDTDGNMIWEQEVDKEGNLIFENSYEIRYLKNDGTIITKSEYDNLFSQGESVYIAAFVGCTYHCG